jgi:hypothetical protein
VPKEILDIVGNFSNMRTLEASELVHVCGNRVVWNIIIFKFKAALNKFLLKNSFYALEE